LIKHQPQITEIAYVRRSDRRPVSGL